MTNLIPQLENEHRRLKTLLDEVKAAGVASEAGRRKLRDARQVFIDHIAREDREFYPDFLRAAAGRPDAERPDAERMARQFAMEMTAMSKGILDFFEKYRDGGDGLEYARDFGRLSAALFLRWRKEEDILYARYAALKTARAAA